MRLSLLTLNAGLLRPLGPLLEPAPHVTRRFRFLAEKLRASGADIVAIQEIYRARHRRDLCAALADLYAHHSDQASRAPLLRLDHGLLLLSRWPMQARFHRLESGTREERWLARRGMIVASLALAGREVRVFNVHATAGGLLFHPEAAEVDAVRERQIAEVLSNADASPGAIPIAAGDFNAGPGASEGNYRAIVEAGWVDCYARLNPGRFEPTWEPGNALNRSGPHRTSPAQRIDHVFVRGGDIEAQCVRPVEARIVFQEPVVPVGNGRTVTLSDHYGLQVALELAAPRQGGAVTGRRRA